MTPVTPRRLILFAGYLSSSAVPPCDLELLGELSRFGEVHVHYDNEPQNATTSTALSGIASSVSFERHGEYDFGSWQRLIERLGWDYLETFDELILVNDSVLVLDHLDRFFSGLTESEALFFAPIFLDEHYVGVEALLPDYLTNHPYDLHSSMFASFFWSMRRELFTHYAFREFIDSIDIQQSRIEVSHRYERGFSRTILRHEFPYTTLVDRVYPQSAIYTRHAFLLAAHGFPVIKKKALTAHFYPISFLSQRIEMLRATADPAFSAGLAGYLGDMNVRSRAARNDRSVARRERRSPVQGRLRRMRDVVVLASSLDRRWYLSQNPDVLARRVSALLHYIRHGIREGRSPAPGIPGRIPQHEIPAHGGPGRRLTRRYLRRNRELLSAALGSPGPETLLVFFNVSTAELSGGMLSINRLAALSMDMLADDTRTAVLISGVPLGRETVTYTRFDSAREPIHFRAIAALTRPKNVVLLLPEVYAIDFIRSLTAQQRAWLAERRVQVVILDQNNDYMPQPHDLLREMSEITVQTTITTAHETYTTQELSSRFVMPVKRLTPLLPEMVITGFAAKQPVVMVSPDQLAHDEDGIAREEFIEQLSMRLPGLRIVTVEDMSLREYLELASSCVMSVTLGEGLDGYFIEPVLAGGVSFALTNPGFFPESFDGCFSLALSIEHLVDLIADSWEIYSADPARYDRDSQDLRALIDDLYSRERTLADLKALLSGREDFFPTPQTQTMKPFDDVRSFLGDQHGFKFVEPTPTTSVAVTQENQVIEHFGGAFYSVLSEIYSSKDDDALLRPSGVPTVLIDIGMNVGAVTVYLASRNREVFAVYGYEPIASLVRVARRNFARNLSLVPHLKAIALSDRFGREKAELIDGWTTAFSIDDPVLNEHLKMDSSGERHGVFQVEVEVVPAAVELEQVLLSHPGCRFILKCDAQGSEFRIFADLGRSGLLARFDIVVVESHFHSPAPILAVLEEAGFVVATRLDSPAHQRYLIVAERPGASSS